MSKPFQPDIATIERVLTPDDLYIVSEQKVVRQCYVDNAAAYCVSSFTDEDLRTYLKDNNGSGAAAARHFHVSRERIRQRVGKMTGEVVYNHRNTRPKKPAVPGGPV